MVRVTSQIPENMPVEGVLVPEITENWYQEESFFAFQCSFEAVWVINGRLSRTNAQNRRKNKMMSAFLVVISPDSLLAGSGNGKPRARDETIEALY